MAVPVAIKELVEGKSVSASRLGVRMEDLLSGEQLLAIETHGSRKLYKARNTDALLTFLISYDESYRVLRLGKEATELDTRAAQAAATGNSKLVKVRTCPGFLVNSYKPIQAQLNGVVVTINPAEGSFVFISDWQTFSIPEDAVVIGIENMENFRKIRQQKAFFESYLQSVYGRVPQMLFASRYPQTTDLRNWLISIPNRYIHFGDFDLAGIHIFETEFGKYLEGRSSFLIPTDIQQRLQNGSSLRYDNQYARFKNLHSDNAQLQALIDLINHTRKCYDQEGYIDNSEKV